MRSWGYLVLHSSASLGQEDQVRELISNGHPLNLRDRLGKTALYSCVDAYRNSCEKQEKQILSCIELLLEAGADLMVESKLGFTPLDGAVLHGVPFNHTGLSCEMKKEENEVIELCYSPYGMDKNKSCKKMGELIKLFSKYYARIIGNGDLDFSWLANYAMLDQSIDECLTDVFGILEMKAKHILDVILLRSLMGERPFQLFVLAAIKHGVQTNLNLYAIREPSNFVHLLLELDDSISIKRMKYFKNFSRTPIGNLTIVFDVYDYLEAICKKDKTMITYMMQIFKILKEVSQIKYSKYLSLLMRLRSVDSITLMDLKQGLLNYVQKYNAKRRGQYSQNFRREKYQEAFQNSLMHVYLFIMEWIEHRPEDVDTGTLLRDLIENKFEAYCTLHYLIQLSNTKEFWKCLTSFVEPEEDRGIIMNSGDVGLRLVDFLITQALNRCTDGFRTDCDGGTALHFAAVTGRIELLTFLVCEKDIYLYAIDNRYQTFLDVLSVVHDHGCAIEEYSRAKLKDLLELIRPLMLLKPLKTLCAETISKNKTILQLIKTQFGDNHPLVKFINLHVCPENRTPSEIEEQMSPFIPPQ